ncbi:MAG: translocation/assembly module TamB domain-containing protein, partial [Pseudomonadales bacterium]|nr:translocation/assembly module TamB domain-containing protein [Pseudomonadales bacterium]
DLELALDLDETLTARGLIETRGGSVARFGRELAIARGRLAFDGPISRPDLDVTATRAVGTREVGVTISGPPDALQTTLFSSPPADDATTLTMLVTGREPSEASPEDADRVTAAALGLGVGVANPVLQELGERFGIEEFGIDTGTGTGAVVAGTRLSKRLYARYAYTLATRSSGLQLEYQISDRLSARTETGAVTALDLLYRREFD